MSQQPPLTRSTTTAASRITLPFYVLWNVGLGATWIFQDERRSSIGLRAISDYLPVDLVGGVVALVGLTIAAGLTTHVRAVVAATLLGAFVVYIILGLAVVWGLDPTLSFHPWPDIELENISDSLTACYWFFGLAVFHFASAASLFFDGPGD